MSDEIVPTIEDCLYLSTEADWEGLTQDEAETLLAELAELRRKAANWDEARRIANSTIPFLKQQIELTVWVGQHAEQIERDYRALGEENARLRALVRHLRQQNDVLRGRP